MIICEVRRFREAFRPNAEVTERCREVPRSAEKCREMPMGTKQAWLVAE